MPSISPWAASVANIRTPPLGLIATTPCPDASRSAYTVFEPKLQPRWPTAGSAMYGSSPPGLW